MKSSNRNISLLIISIVTVLAGNLPAQYVWLDNYDSLNAIYSRIPVPAEYRRVEAEEGSFQNWLRHLPLKDGNPPVYLYDSRKKSNQLANFAVIDIDVGKKDLQQCADAVIRLRAEYLYSTGEFDSIAFNFTSGDGYRYVDWLDGLTPVVDAENVRWKEGPKRENSRSNFRKYLEIVFTYAGSYSLSRELVNVENINDIRIGDVFIEGGFPGHAVIVVDMAREPETQDRVFLLAQSFTPAQDMHIIRNPVKWSLSPWFKLNQDGGLITLEWIFKEDQLMRFP
jgi:hypothetical protein